MPSNPISLAEALRMIDEDKIDDPRLLEFAREIEHIGTDLLKDRKDNELIGMVALLQSAALTLMVADEKIDAYEFLAMLLNPSNLFFTATIMKMSIGLAAYEELR